MPNSLREKLTKTTKTLEDRIEECRTRNAEISAKGKDIANECSGFNEKINEISVWNLFFDLVDIPL